LLTFLSLTTKVALTVTAPGMLEALTSATIRFTPLVTGLRNIFGYTHDHRKVRKHTDVRNRMLVSLRGGGGELGYLKP
jgi:hypothetical protein